MAFCSVKEDTQQFARNVLLRSAALWLELDEQILKTVSHREVFPIQTEERLPRGNGESIFPAVSPLLAKRNASDLGSAYELPLLFENALEKRSEERACWRKKQSCSLILRVFCSQ